MGGEYAYAAGAAGAGVGGALLLRHAEHPMLMAWVDALHCMIYGLAQWHSRARWFQASREMAGWKIAVSISPACPDPFELP